MMVEPGEHHQDSDGGFPVGRSRGSQPRSGRKQGRRACDHQGIGDRGRIDGGDEETGSFRHRRGPQQASDPRRLDPQLPAAPMRIASMTRPSRMPRQKMTVQESGRPAAPAGPRSWREGSGQAVRRGPCDRRRRATQSMDLPAPQWIQAFGHSIPHSDASRCFDLNAARIDPPCTMPRRTATAAPPAGCRSATCIAPTGNSRVTVVPLPSSLSTSSCPPMSSDEAFRNR